MLTRFRIILALLLATNFAFAQSSVSDEPSTAYKTQDACPRKYELYPTQNIWTFIKLNTRNGKMYQVQFSTEGNRMVTILSDFALCNQSEEFDGKYKLYETQNMWNFILLDREEGYTYQVQWSTDPDARMVLPIF